MIFKYFLSQILHIFDTDLSSGKFENIANVEIYWICTILQYTILLYSQVSCQNIKIWLMEICSNSIYKILIVIEVIYSMQVIGIGYCSNYLSSGKHKKYYKRKSCKYNRLIVRYNIMDSVYYGKCIWLCAEARERLPKCNMSVRIICSSTIKKICLVISFFLILLPRELTFFSLRRCPDRMLLNVCCSNRYLEYISEI